MNSANVLRSSPSEFAELKQIEYFAFEEDFVEANIRCIPMIVRFKLDRVGIKLKLSEWVKFNKSEKINLALFTCESIAERDFYHQYLCKLIYHYTGNDATQLAINPSPAWAQISSIPESVVIQASDYNCNIRITDWAALTDLQRFALLKLSKEGHENKNFPKALHEFGLERSFHI